MANIKFNSAILSTIGLVAGIPAIGDSLTATLERICVKKFEGNQISLALWLKSEFAETGKVPEMGLTSESEVGQELIALAQQLDRPSSPYADIDRVLARAYSRAVAYLCTYNHLYNHRDDYKDKGSEAKLIDIDTMAGKVYDRQLDEVPWSSLGYGWRAGKLPSVAGYWTSVYTTEGKDLGEEERKALDDRLSAERLAWYAERDKIRADNQKTTDEFNAKISGLKAQLEDLGLTKARAKAVASWAFGGGKTLTCPTTTDEGKTWVFAIKPAEMVNAYDNREKKTRK